MYGHIVKNSYDIIKEKILNMYITFMCGVFPVHIIFGMGMVK